VTHSLTTARARFASYPADGGQVDANDADLKYHQFLFIPVGFKWFLSLKVKY
jgi:hypothetical protein